MTDRELLKLAAKAAGYVVVEYASDGVWIHLRGAVPNKAGECPIFWWEPLIDDGDALRLAVKLGLRVGTDGQSFKPFIMCWKPHVENICVYEAEGNDPYAATRRAIVRAAAEIGKGMK